MKKIKDYILEKIALTAIDLMSSEANMDGKPLTLEDIEASESMTDREKLFAHLSILTSEDDIDKGFYDATDRIGCVTTMYDLVKEYFLQSDDKSKAAFTSRLNQILKYDAGNRLYRRILIDANRDELVQIQKAIEEKMPIIRH